MTTIYTPQTPINITGEDLTPAVGGLHRKYQLPSTLATIDTMIITLGTQILQPINHFTVSAGEIDFNVDIDYSADVLLTIQYSIPESTTFAGTEIERIRLMMIQVNDSGIMSDDFVQIAIDDASILQNSTDTIAIRLYACYLIAWRWESLKETTSMEGVNYKRPDPNTYLLQYNTRIKMLSSTSGIGFIKVSTDKDFVYDNTTKVLRRRVDENDTD